MTNKFMGQIVGLLVLCISLLFTSTLASAADAPNLHSPTNRATSVSERTQNFDWSTVSGATAYRIVVADNSSFFGFNDTGGSDTSCTNSSKCKTARITSSRHSGFSLRSGQRYYWKVRASNSEWSSVYYFTTKSNTPQISSFNPTTLTAKDGNQTLTLNGSGFTRDTQVEWKLGNDGRTLPNSSVTYSSSTRIKISFNTTKTGYGTWYFTPKNGSQKGNRKAFEVKQDTPTPQISSFNPTTLTAKDGNQTLTLNGSGFTRDTQVEWKLGNDGRTLPNSSVTYSSSTRIKISFNTTKTGYGTWYFTPKNGSQKGNRKAFEVKQDTPTPQISSFNPTTLTAKDGNQTLTLNGSGFTRDTQVEWKLGNDGRTLPNSSVTYSSSTRIKISFNTTKTGYGTWYFTPKNGSQKGNRKAFEVKQDTPTPQISSFNPTTLTAKDGNQTLTLNGSGFTRDTQVEWKLGNDGRTLPNSSVTYSSSTRIKISFNTTKTGYGTWYFTPKNGSQKGNRKAFEVKQDTPTPQISSFNPTTLTAKDGNQTLTLNGSGFTRDTQVEWKLGNDGRTLPNSSVTYSSSTRIKISFNTTKTGYGTWYFTPKNGSQKGNRKAFEVKQDTPTPQISSFNPTTLTAKDGNQTLTLNGSGFTRDTQVEWKLGNDGRTLPNSSVTYSSSTRIKISFNTTKTGYGTWYFTPKNGSQKGNRKAFEVKQDTPTPQISSFNPTTLTAKDGNQTLTLNGSGFTRDTQVEWKLGNDGRTLPNSSVTYSSSTRIKISFNTTKTGYGTWYFTPKNGSQKGNRKAFEVKQDTPTPQISSFNPTTLTAKDGNQTLTLNGSGFTRDTQVEWKLGNDGRTLPNSSVTYSSSTRIKISFNTTKTGYGTWYFTPKNGSQKGNRKAFEVKQDTPTPQISSFNPTTLTAKDGNQTLTLNGSGFTRDTQVEWKLGNDGRTLPNSSVTYSSSTRIKISFNTTKTGYGTWYFTPKNGSQKGNRKAFEVKQDTPTPQISSFNPTTLTAKDGNQTLTLNGSGFTRDTQVEWKLGNDGRTLPNSSVTYSSSTRIKISFNTTKTGYGTWYFTPKNGSQKGNRKAFEVKQDDKDPEAPHLSVTQNLPNCKSSSRKCVVIGRATTLKFRVTDSNADLTKIDINWDGEGSPERSLEINGGSHNVSSSYTFSNSQISSCPDSEEFRVDGACWKKNLTATATAYDESGKKSNVYSQTFILYDLDKYNNFQQELDSSQSELGSAQTTATEQGTTAQDHNDNVTNLSNTCNAIKNFSSNNPNELRPADPFRRLLNGDDDFCRKDRYTLIKCSHNVDSQCTLSAAEPFGKGVTYEIKTIFDYANYTNINQNSCINYPALVKSNYAIDGIIVQFEESVVYNFQQKTDYHKAVTLRLKDELIDKSGGRFVGKCNINDYQEWTLTEWREEVKRHSGFDNAVRKYAQTYGVSNATAAQGVADGVAKALHEIVSGYKALPDTVANTISGAFTLIGNFIDDPAATASQVRTGVANASATAIQIGKEIAEIIPTLPDAIADLTVYEKSFFSAYVATHVAHELSPSAKLKLLRLNKLKRPKWVEDALIAVRLYKEPRNANVSVYVSYRPSDGAIQYVGITNNIRRRGTEHFANKGIKIKSIGGLKNLTREDAKGCEQFLINLYGLGKQGNGEGQLFFNQINSIAKINPIHKESVVRGKHLLDSVGFDYNDYLR